MWIVAVRGMTLAAFIAAAGAGCALEPSPPRPDPTATPTPAGRKEFVFKGKVDAVDPAGKTLTVSNENVEGWMAPMQMMYKADKDDVYTRVKPGDQITARVYDGIEDMLYDVQVIPDQKR
ncbi:MAG TPA: copper-binding protein [Vicinamibacterales bacterium]|nr:copper-binding protein [Vicinamibacterales bacterium]